MNTIKLVTSDNTVVRGEGTDYRIANFITKDVSANVSLAVSELSGEMPKTMNTQSDRLYYFIEADAEFVFADETIRVTTGSTLFIPKCTQYKAAGSFHAVLINAPAFDISAEQHFE